MTAGSNGWKTVGYGRPIGDRPADGLLPVLAAQARFPVLSADEMAGHGSENEIAGAVQGEALSAAGLAHGALAKRVEAIPDYRERLDSLQMLPLTYDGIAEALAAFMAHEWRADQSAFDKLVCEGVPLDARAEAGRRLFLRQGRMCRLPCRQVSDGSRVPCHRHAADRARQGRGRRIPRSRQRAGCW